MHYSPPLDLRTPDNHRLIIIRVNLLVFDAAMALVYATVCAYHIHSANHAESQFASKMHMLSSAQMLSV